VNAYSKCAISYRSYLYSIYIIRELCAPATGSRLPDKQALKDQSKACIIGNQPSSKPKYAAHDSSRWRMSGGMLCISEHIKTVYVVQFRCKEQSCDEGRHRGFTLAQPREIILDLRNGTLRISCSCP
jgi:hypothetical protein